MRACHVDLKSVVAKQRMGPGKLVEFEAGLDLSVILAMTTDDQKDLLCWCAQSEAGANTPATKNRTERNLRM